MATEIRLTCGRLETNLIGVGVGQKKVGGFDVCMHIFMVMDVLQNVKLEMKDLLEYEIL